MKKRYNNYYKILKHNNLLRTDKEAKKILKDKEYHLLYNYGKDENFIVWIPYIPLFITPLLYNNL